MSSDVPDPERALERWLRATASPAPGHVIESVLATVSAKPSPLGSRRGLGSVLGVVAAMIVLAVSLGLGPGLGTQTGRDGDRGGLGVPGATPTTTRIPNAEAWDPASEFASAGEPTNPAPDLAGRPGVWTYGHLGPDGLEPDAVRVFPRRRDGIWEAPGFPNLVAYRERGSVILHPYGGGADRRFSALMWTSPVAGQLEIRGFVALSDTTCATLVDVDGVDVIVSLERRPLDVIRLASGTSMVFLEDAVEVGERLLIAVNPRANSTCDSTAIRLTLTVRP